MKKVMKVNTEIRKLTELKIGPYTAHSIPTGLFGLDGGAMFGTVPKVLWEKTNPPDEQNRISMEARALLLQDPENKKYILIDTGNGGDFIAKYGEKLGASFAKMYNVDQSGPSLVKSLAVHGFKPTDITDVILTHLHFDHAGGATTTDSNGKVIPTFPNAIHYVQAANLETAKNPNRREKASYFPANFQPLIDAGKLKLLSGPQHDLLPGINTSISHGHTQGHQNVIIADSTSQLIYCGDVVPTSSHVRSAWIMGYDLDPLKLIEEKRALLARSSEKLTYYFFEHDPYCEFATVEFLNDEFKVKEKFVLV